MRVPFGPSTPSAHSGHDAGSSSPASSYRQYPDPRDTARYDAPWGSSGLRESEAVPLRLVVTHAHGRRLQLGLPRDRIDGRRDERADSRVAGKQATPVHRHERLARHYGIGDLEAHDDAAQRRRDLDEVAER